MRVVPQEEEPGLTFEDLFADSLTFTMLVKGKPLTISWTPAAFTPDVQELMAPLLSDPDEEADLEHEAALEALADDESLDPTVRTERTVAREQLIRDRQVALSDRRDIANVAIRQFILRLVTSWSLKRNGEPVALDEPSLKTLPPAFLELVMERMMENAGPKEVTESP